jgi:hypothetical protein
MKKMQMGESQWITCPEPEPMLDFLQGNITQRKLRLLACAACRYVWNQLADKRCQRAVEVAEHYADGQESNKELEKAYHEACDAIGNQNEAGQDAASAAAVVHNACYSEGGWMNTKKALTCAAAVAVQQAARDAGAEGIAAPNSEDQIKRRENENMAHLIREIVGNPFQPVSFDPQWLTTPIRFLAQTIYDDFAFDRLPELAASLQSVGCDCEAILEHCRDQKPHYRGCWVLDLVLGKR